MTFSSLIAEIQGRRQRVVVYRSGDRLEIETWFADHGVDVESRSLPADGPNPFLEIETDGEVTGVIGVEAVEALLEPPIRRPDDRTGISDGYRALFDVLERTVFSGMNRRELLAVSREIEDRAFRVGDGTLWVSFQTLSTFRSQTEVYRTLGAETSLEIHVHGVEDWAPPAIPGITYHTGEAARFEPYWVLAYDGGPDEEQACGLVVEERSDEYTGFWTNDPTVVEDIATTFEAG
ncbi:Diguanylate Cyclase and Two-component system sensory domain-containing protein [Halorubrum aquaticum]|uniref:Diguanylate Cyclase and Two-component system sensory domain-containing protein n=1 Tax=Halorubrum aquaticum TaxID=387340 RepID=A0A1I2Z2J4_9EURY|nr:DICT sensory domain-containing protein [Halorubrum aquaticum]SFH32082.1 Diguanylate Cyclase and Two-component system sensory domain-containing protein [Halorubrum aquaticum]